MLCLTQVCPGALAKLLEACLAFTNVQLTVGATDAITATLSSAPALSKDCMQKPCAVRSTCVVAQASAKQAMQLVVGATGAVSDRFGNLTKLPACISCRSLWLHRFNMLIVGANAATSQDS